MSIEVVGDPFFSDPTKRVQVGWLRRDDTIETGPVDMAIAAKLVELLANLWEPAFSPHPRTSGAA